MKKAYEAVYECFMCGNQIKMRSLNKKDVQNQKLLCVCHFDEMSSFSAGYPTYNLKEIKEIDIEFVQIHFDIPTKIIKSMLKKRKEASTIAKIIRNLDPFAPDNFYWFEKDTPKPHHVLSFWTDKSHEIEEVLRSKGYIVEIVEPKY